MASVDFELHLVVKDREGDDVRIAVFRSPNRLDLQGKGSIGEAFAGSLAAGSLRFTLQVRGAAAIEVPFSLKEIRWLTNEPDQRLSRSPERGNRIGRGLWSRAAGDKGVPWIGCPRCGLGWPVGRHTIKPPEKEGEPHKLDPSFVCPGTGCGGHFNAVLEDAAVAAGQCPTCAHGVHTSACTDDIGAGQFCGCRAAERPAGEG